MLARVLSFCLILLATLSGLSAYRFLEVYFTAEVYRERLAELSNDYEDLRGLYSEAVRRTAVTELLVAEGNLTVIIRTAEGQVQAIATPFDPEGEIYVDYVVLNGRLWIRRLFDSETPPRQGLVIDPQLASIDWDAEGASHGKAAYRSLSPGRWVVDVTGDGSLGLTKRRDDEQIDLSPAPPVRQYEPVEYLVKDGLEAIRPSEALRVLWRQIASSL